MNGRRERSNGIEPAATGGPLTLIFFRLADKGLSDKLRLKPRDAGVMRIEPSIVVDVDARKRSAGSSVVEDPSCHVRLGRIWRRRTRPDPIVVRLIRQGAHIGRCCRDMADKQEQRTMKFSRQMTP
jgi:hypothetical protein